MNLFDGLKQTFNNMGDMIDRTALQVSESPPEIEISQEQIDADSRMIKNAENYHKIRFYKKAKRYYDYMRSIVRSDTIASANKLDKETNDRVEIDDIFCNEFWTNVQVMVPNLYFQNPRVSITPLIEAALVPQSEIDLTTGQLVKLPPKMVDGQAAASLAENVIYDYYKHLKAKQTIQMVTYDAVVTGLGWSKMVWHTELSGAEKDDITVIKDDVTWERLNPLNVFVDPEATSPDLSDAKYIILKYFKPTEVIKKNPLYKGVEKLKGTKQLMFSGDDKNASNADMYKAIDGDKPDVDRNVLYEVYDRINRKIKVYVDGMKRPIRYDDWNDEFPVKALMFNRDAESFYPIADFTAYEAQVLLKTKLRRKMVDLFNKLNRIYAVNSNIVDKEKVQAMLDSNTGGVIPVPITGSQSIRDILVNLNDFTMNDSYLALQNVADTDIERLSGINDAMRGLITSAKRTATEMLNISGSANLRIEMKKDVVANYVEDCTLRMLTLLQQNVDEKRVQKVIHEEQTQWLPWNKDDIAGRFAISIDVGDMTKQNPEMKAKQALEAYQMYVASPFVDQVDLTKNALKWSLPFMKVKLNERAVQNYLNPNPEDKPKEDKTKLSISLKLEPLDLLNPQVTALLESAGIQIPTSTPSNPSQGLPAVPASSTLGGKMANMQKIGISPTEAMSGAVNPQEAQEAMNPTSGTGINDLI